MDLPHKSLSQQKLSLLSDHGLIWTGILWKNTSISCIPFVELISLIEGSIPETLPQVCTKKIAYLHLDMKLFPA
jgi:hypothetical protein